MESLNNIHKQQNAESPASGINSTQSDVLQIFKNFTAEDIEKIKLLAGLFGIGSGYAYASPGQAQQSSTGGRKDVSVEQAFSEYNKLIEFNLAKKSVDTAKTAERRFLEFIPGNRSLNTIERKEAENLMMKISKSAPLGCYNYLKVYRTMFNVFVDWNYIASNPADVLKRAVREMLAPTKMRNDLLKRLIIR